jgi:proteasome lid subunit RPN8/RPN11
VVAEWHSHLGGNASPSRLDLDTHDRFLSDPNLSFELVVSLIVTVGGQSEANL